MRVIGVNCYGHDASASVVEDGRVIGMASEERFNRVKMSGEFPCQALRYCLSLRRPSPSDKIYGAFFLNPRVCAWRKAGFIANCYLRGRRTSAEAEIIFTLKLSKLKKKTDATLVNCGYPRTAEFFFVEHHYAHAASAFYPSGFDRAAILSLDGVGEWCTTLLAVGEGIRIRPLHRIYFPNSLGLVYAAVTQYLGFDPGGDEYKVMGLASYGKPAYYKEFSDIIKRKRRGNFSVDMKYFTFHSGLLQDNLISRAIYDVLGAPVADPDQVSQHNADIAASLQKVLEDTVFDMLAHLRALTKSDNLCLAGGVALNCAMNGRILREGPFKNIFVPPYAGDMGTAAGAALYVEHALFKKPHRRVLDSAYLGPEYANDIIEPLLKGNKLRYRRCENIVQTAAELISRGNVVGWFQGRMEFGPRALGARSILADPRREEMKDVVNARIKHREPFRPFAPSVLEENAPDFFVGCSASPFMTVVYPVRDDKKKIIPAVTHVDGTARVHTVDRETHPRYRDLLEAFRNLTGVPVLLNTSFNVKGEPIVCSPEDAIRCFYSTGLDYLAIGDFLVEK